MKKAAAILLLFAIVSFLSCDTKDSQEITMMAASGSIKLNISFKPTDVGGTDSSIALLQLFLWDGSIQEYVEERPCHPGGGDYVTPVQFYGLPAGTYRVTVSAATETNEVYGARNLKGYFYDTASGAPPGGGNPTVPDASSSIIVTSGSLTTKAFKKSW